MPVHGRDAAGGGDPSLSGPASSRAGRRIRSGWPGRRRPWQRGKHRGPAPRRIRRSAPGTRPGKGTKPLEQYARRQSAAAGGKDAYARRGKRLSTHHGRTTWLRAKGFREHVPP
jgi:hypothetical protein